LRCIISPACLTTRLPMAVFESS